MTHANDQWMLLDFEMYSSIFLGSNVIKIVNKIINVLNLLSANYLYYWIYVPVNYNCTYVLSSTFHVIDFFVLHVYALFNGSPFIHLCGEKKSCGRGGGDLIFSSHSISHNLW